MFSLAKNDSPNAQQNTRLRLHYLDGLRGLAALYVVLHHSFLEVAAVKGWLPNRWGEATKWAWNGQIAVQVFIVLSGYCLMMPVARYGSLKGGWAGFIKRRARRILPPYYAALALSLAIIFVVPGMGLQHGLRWDITLPATGWGVLGSHLLLLQDLRDDWIHKINYPMWSIAQEWQIYFVFAFLLLPMWRYTGILTTVFFAFLVSVAIGRIPGHDLTFAAPEFLFLFSVGMCAATISFAGSSKWLTFARDRVPWALLTAGFWMGYAALMLRRPELTQIHSWRLTLLAGAAMLSTLALCTNSSQNRQGNNFLLRLCESESVVILGTFSYSLYLVHAPILAMFTLALHHWQAPGLLATAVELFIAVPVATAFAYGFHLVAERPFMLGHPESLKRAEKAAILDTAP
jgi:peptidoglycan/LPS O-acetylase OafA/YrhL